MPQADSSSPGVTAANGSVASRGDVGEAAPAVPIESGADGQEPPSEEDSARKKQEKKSESKHHHGRKRRLLRSWTQITWRLTLDQGVGSALRCLVCQPSLASVEACRAALIDSGSSKLAVRTLVKS